MSSASRCAILLLSSTLLLPLGCGSGEAASKTTTTTLPTTAKPILHGLVTQGPGITTTPPANAFEELYAHPGVYSAVVVQLFWSQLEPSQNTFNDSSLTSALATIASYNAQYPATPVTAKLRIFMGLGTPAWVAAATGPVTVSNGTASVTVGEYWTTTYDTLWQALQAHLASEYDSSPLISEVAVTSCSSLTGEPFIMVNDQADIAILHSAGYTDAQYETCLSNAPADFAAWKTTPLDYTFNALTQTDTGSAVSNTTFPITVMDAFRASLGTRGVIANHGLNDPLTTSALPIYANFTTLENTAVSASSSSPLEFQTVSPTVDWSTVIPFGLTYNPTEIEIWDTTAAGGSAPLTQSQLATWAAALK